MVNEKTEDDDAEALSSQNDDTTSRESEDNTTATTLALSTSILGLRAGGGEASPDGDLPELSAIGAVASPTHLPQTYSASRLRSILASRTLCLDDDDEADDDDDDDDPSEICLKLASTDHADTG